MLGNTLPPGGKPHAHLCVVIFLDQLRQISKQSEMSQKKTTATFRSFRPCFKRSDFSDAASDIPHESADVKWDELFTKCPDIGDAILVNSDTESALNCRLVCKAWRVRVNECKPLWSRSGI